jgi:UDP-N-acetyl-D-mannosaminuronate dehydrogenase
VTTLGGLRARLEERLRSRAAVVGVVGPGSVGPPLAVAFARAGFPVIAVDTEPSRAARLAAGASPVEDVPGDELAPLARDGRLRVRSSPEALDTRNATGAPGALPHVIRL